MKRFVGIGANGVDFTSIYGTVKSLINEDPPAKRSDTHREVAIQRQEPPGRWRFAHCPG